MTIKKPKILHIGGSHSVHVADLVSELHAQGYPQCVLSYKRGNLLPKRVPTYFYPYNKFYPNNTLPKDEEYLKRYISSILQKEKPNIIHGHFLAFSCVAINLASGLSGLPLYLTPWSSRAWIKDKVLFSRINYGISRAKYFLLDQRWVFDIFKSYYKHTLKDSMHVPWRMPLYLSTHHDFTKEQKDTSRPKLLSARVMQDRNHQELFVQALPIIFEKHPDATATLMIGQSAAQGNKYFNLMVALAKKLGIFNRCHFINRALSQVEFSKLIKEHNIVYSVSESDMGGSQTTYQSMYAGAITIVKTSSYGYLPLVPNKNSLVTDLTKEAVQKVLLYAADHVKELCGKFFDNSRTLRLASNEYMLPILTKLYDKEVVK